MAFNYANAQQTALKLLTNFGRDVEVRRFTGGTFNGVSGEYSGGADIVDTVKAAILPASKRYASRFPEDIVIKTESYAIIDAVNTSYSPLAGDRLVFGNVTQEILGAATIEPSGTPIVHTVALIKR